MTQRDFPTIAKARDAKRHLRNSTAPAHPVKKATGHGKLVKFKPHAQWWHDVSGWFAVELVKAVAARDEGTVDFLSKAIAAHARLTTSVRGLLDVSELQAELKEMKGLFAELMAARHEGTAGISTTGPAAQIPLGDERPLH
jgi:hypothetical protein